MSYSWDRPDAPVTAGIGVRLAAFIIDVLIASGIFVLLAILLVATGVMALSVEGPSDLRAILVPVALLYLPVILVYFTVAEAWWQATPGKSILGLEVRRMDGDPPTLFDSFIRNVFRFLWFLPPIAGWFPTGAIFIVADGFFMWRGELDQRTGDHGGRTIVVRSSQ